MRENIVYVSLRLNMDVPKHVEINKKLQKLNPNVYKSKNQFVIEALEFYIQNFGNEQYMLEKEPSPFITKVELKDILSKFREDILKESRNDVMGLVGGMFSGIRDSPTIVHTANDETEVENTKEPALDKDPYFNNLIDGVGDF